METLTRTHSLHIDLSEHNDHNVVPQFDKVVVIIDHGKNNEDSARK